jgi:uncharacterized protein YndB with AHSA1/START domain
MSDSGTNRTKVERTSERELTVTRSFDAPAHILFQAWTTPALFMRWWVPKSAGINLLSCDMDVRVGGGYRLEFGLDADNSMAFYGKYIEVIPNARIVWTNEEEADGAVTTVTFAEKDGRTLLTYHEAYPTPEGVEEALSGSASGMPEQLDQLELLLGEMGAGG